MKKLSGFLFFNLIMGLGTLTAQTPTPQDTIDKKDRMERDTMMAPMGKMPKDSMYRMRKNGRMKNKTGRDSMPMDKNRTRRDSIKN